MKKCAKCDLPVLRGTGQKYCADHKLTRDGDSQGPMAQRALKYNIRIQDLEKMHEEQDDRCAICGRSEVIDGRSLVVDHDHRCCAGQKSCGECIRALLCSSCNRALGFFGDSPELLRKAAEYLERY